AAVVACLKLDAKHAFSPDEVSTGTLEATGDLSFTITTEHPVGDIVAELANFEQYMIFDAAAYKEAGDDDAALVKAGLYTGPFEPVSLDKRGMKTRANPHYWGGQVKLPGEQIRFVSNPESAVQAVEN